MLGQIEIVDQLRQSGLLDSKSVVRNDLVVTEASRRNRNVRITSRDGPNYFVKHGTDSGRIASIAHEAKAYRFLTSQGAIAPYLPKFYGYTKSPNLLVLELVPRSMNLREYHSAHRRFSISAARRLGTALARIHTLAPRRSFASTDAPAEMEHPWVLSLGRPHAGILREASNANISLFRIVQASRSLVAGLDELRESWRPTSLIHADIKWDNILVFPQNERANSVKIIDWEFTRNGDPLWDIGAVFMSYLSFWLQWMPIAGETPAEQLTKAARFPLASMRPAIRTFWTSYKAQQGFTALEARSRLLSSVRYTAARLIQTAYEQMQGSTQLSAHVVTMLQLAINIMERPGEASVHLLGLGLEA